MISEAQVLLLFSLQFFLFGCFSILPFSFLVMFCCYLGCAAALPSCSLLWISNCLNYFSSPCCIKSFSKVCFSLSLLETLPFPLICCIFHRPILFFSYLLQITINFGAFVFFVFGKEEIISNCPGRTRRNSQNDQGAPHSCRWLLSMLGN